MIPEMDITIAQQAIDSFKRRDLPVLDSSRNVMVEYANYCELKQNNDKYIRKLEQNLLKNAVAVLELINEQYDFK